MQDPVIPKKTLAVDFDGVISYYSGFKGKGVFGPPIKGCREMLNELIRNEWIIIINTTRSEEQDIKTYLKFHGIPYHHINYNPENDQLQLSKTKVVAHVYLDDRAVRFNGDWKEAAQQIMNFEPWWRKESTNGE